MMSNARPANRMFPTRDTSDFVIIGGVAAGPKTAATLARRIPGARITLFEKGELLSYAGCGLPYFASGDVNRLAQLTETPYGVPRDAQYFSQVKGFTALTQAEVVAIDRKRKVVQVRLEGESVLREHGYGKLVLATGSRPATPPFPIVDTPRIRTFTRPEDAVAIRRLAEKGKISSAVIIGGGYIGCEMAEALGGLWGIATTLVEKEQHVLPAALDPEMSRLVERELDANDIELRTGCAVGKVVRDPDGDGVAVQLATDEIIVTDLALLCIGVVPETTLARQCGLELGPSGGITVDDHLRTSDPDIYAGGDCIELNHRLTGEPAYVPLGSLANRHGRVIAENLAGNETAYPGVLGSFLVKVFDLNVGGVGLNSRTANRVARKPAAVWATCADRPDYFPESKTIMLKMLYDEHDGRLLGLQAVGQGDIARRVDVFSGFLQFNGTVKDLLDFEHGYAPPFNEAIDPLHHLAAIATAQQRGVEFLGPGGVDQLTADRAVWVDVREIEEQQANPVDLPSIMGIPLDRIRAERSTLPRDKMMVLVCQRGGRAYQAAVILRGAGVANVAVLGGGKAMLGE